jgi:hypothetical protein
MYPCPCCGYLVFDEPAGSDDICEICFWHDDLSQLRFPRMTGANHVSLLDAQRNYREFGACEERVLAFARRPTAADDRDETCRVSITVRATLMTARTFTTGAHCVSPRPNQAMQLTASKPAVYASFGCHRDHMLRFMHRGLAAADLVTR